MRTVKIRKKLLFIGIFLLCMAIIEVQFMEKAYKFNFKQIGARRHTMTKPHIVLIVADDLGYNDVGYHGSDIKTPNIDWLAKSGVRLENYYVQPTCTPTRGQLLTGKYQIHTGLHWVLRPATPSGLGLDHTTLAEKLRESGYSTHLVGKWHVGFFKRGYLPTRRGFDSFFGFLTGHSDYYTHVTNQYGKVFMSGYDLMENEQQSNMTKYNGQYSTHLFANKVIDIIQRNDPDKPMFIYVSFQAVHSPMQVPDYYTKWNNNITDSVRKKYAGMVSCMDEAVGHICDAMKQRAFWKNTVLIFTTDNGANPKVGGSNWPLRGAKGSLWEGGIRAVGFVYSDLLDIQRNGYISKELMHITDWFPTLVNLAGGNLSETERIDGFDQWETIMYNLPSSRQEILHNIEPQVPGHIKCSIDACNAARKASLRVGKFKVVIGFPGPIRRNYLSNNTGYIHLFNIDEDPNERIDLADQFQGIVRDLVARLKQYEIRMVSCENPEVDPRADPKYNNGFWQPWVSERTKL